MLLSIAILTLDLVINKASWDSGPDCLFGVGVCSLVGGSWSVASLPHNSQEESWRKLHGRPRTAAKIYGKEKAPEIWARSWMDQEWPSGKRFLITWRAGENWWYWRSVYYGRLRVRELQPHRETKEELLFYTDHTVSISYLSLALLILYSEKLRDFKARSPPNPLSSQLAARTVLYETHGCTWW